MDVIPPHHICQPFALDLGLPPDPANPTEGFATLGAILSLAPDTKVIVVTGNGERENAVRAIGMGAYDFYEKPVEPEIHDEIPDHLDLPLEVPEADALDQEGIPTKRRAKHWSKEAIRLMLQRIEKGEIRSLRRRDEPT